MGYIESAPLFCAITETIADLANHGHQQTQPHFLDGLANSCLPLLDPAAARILTTQQEDQLAAYFNSLPSSLTNHCLSYIDVYVDNFILLQQGLPSQQLAARCNLFHHIDRFFHPKNTHDTTRCEVNSTKNILQGDAAFTVIKKFLAGKSTACFCTSASHPLDYNGS